MKKGIAFALALFFLISSAVCEELTESERAFVGTWARISDGRDGHASMEIFLLTADHQVYYVNQTFEPGEVSFGRQAAKTWYRIGENRIMIIYGENAKSEASILDNGSMALYLSDNRHYYPYTRLQIEKKEETGVRIPAGEWVVGVDIPAGEYSVSSENKSVSMNFVVWKGAKNDYSFGSGKNLSYNLVLNRNNNFLGKIILEEGNTMIIEQPIILDKPVSLDFSL